MSLKYKSTNSYISHIEWTEPLPDQVYYYVELNGKLIFPGATLNVKEEQVVVFIHNDKVADVLGPGIHDLTPQNLPILAMLKKWKIGQNNPFAVDIVFLSTSIFSGAWSTQEDIMIKDIDFGAVRTTISGKYSYKICEPVMFTKYIIKLNILLASHSVVKKKLHDILVDRIVQYIISENISVSSLAVDYGEVSNKIKIFLKQFFNKYGVEIVTFFLTDLKLPEAIEKALKKKLEFADRKIDENEAYKLSETLEAEVKNPTNAEEINTTYSDADDNRKADTPKNFYSTEKPPPVKKYYIIHHGKQKGPFDLSMLKEMAERNKISSSTLIWKEGMNDWLFAENLKDLANLFL
jgi:membrane protease subunit (stomatin/prohibitin family)